MQIVDNTGLEPVTPAMPALLDLVVAGGLEPPTLAM